MTLKTVYDLMNYLVKGIASDEIDKKTLAIHHGYRQLAERMGLVSKCPNELRAESNLATTISTHVAPLPSDYLMYQSIWYLSGSAYYKFDPEQITTLENLMNEIGTNFYDSSNTGTPTRVAFDGDQVVFDRYWAASGTTAIKLSYWQYPAEVTAYDQLTIGTLSGNFTVGETITGGTSNAYATVISNTATTVTVSSSSVVGVFSNAETITGGTSTKTAIVSGAISEKVQVLEVSSKYEFALANAGAMMYHYMDGNIDAAEKDTVLDNIIKQLGATNRIGTIRVRPYA
jgi:hypothetical protein